MPLRRLFERADVVSHEPRIVCLAVDRHAWHSAAADVAATGGRLVSIWSGGGVGTPRAWAAFIADPGLLVLSCEQGEQDDPIAGIEDIFPSAGRKQRAMTDLSGTRVTGSDQRPWLRHAAWPSDYQPLSGGEPRRISDALVADDYPFVRVEGDGVHEIAVGPVHAGIIEPGHFRFSIVGEKVLRLEERLGYVHKGIERRFQDLALVDGHRLAARVSGDSAVAFSWAYCQALETIAGVSVTARAAWLRALALELERIVNHLGDLGALGNDAGFAFGLAQFSRLKEECLRAVEGAFGQRYLLDFVVPGGTHLDPDPGGLSKLYTHVVSLPPVIERLRQIYEEHSGVRDRFVGAGIVAPELARRLGLTGLAGRASGQNFDLRVDHPSAPYSELRPAKFVFADGDVAARVAIRFDELVESIRLVHEIYRGLPDGPYLVPIAPAPEGKLGVGVVEGWRGPVLVALESGESGTIRRCHPHDPSWLNWPVLEHAIIDNIVPDFPLINKSFNLSYSGHDL